MADLSKKEQSVLIQLYREQSVLWDSSHVAYNDRNARKRALSNIQVAFETACGIKLESKFPLGLSVVIGCEFVRCCVCGLCAMCHLLFVLSNECVRLCTCFLCIAM